MTHRHRHSTYKHTQHSHNTHNTYTTLTTLTTLTTHTTHNFFHVPHYFSISFISSTNLFFSLSLSQTQLTTMSLFHMSLKKPDLGVFHDVQIKFDKDFSFVPTLGF